MVTPIGAGLVAAGVIFLFAGAVLSVYGIGLLGAVVGGGGGYLLAPQLGFTELPQVAAAALGGAVVGVALTYLLLSLAIGVLAFAGGTYVGVGAADQVLDDPELLLVAGFALAVGGVAAFLGTIFKRTIMVFVTSVIGAALASRQVTGSDVSNLEEVNAGDILFDLSDPLFLGLFVLGVLTQLGLFRLGYVTKLVSYLPGASVLRDREEESAS